MSVISVYQLRDQEEVLSEHASITNKMNIACYLISTNMVWLCLYTEILY